MPGCNPTFSFIPMKISKRISRETQQKIELALFKVFYYSCRILPSALVLSLGAIIGALAWKLRVRKKTVLENLAIAFKNQYSQDEYTRIATDCYRHFGRELLRILILDRESRRPLESWIDIEGLDILRNREQPGGILVGGHIGCWEVANFVMPKLGEEVTVFTGRHANKVADRWLNEIRARAGTKMLGTIDDREELMERAKKSLVALVGDQRPPKSPVKIEFFEYQTEAAQGPALLSLLNKVDLFYFSCVIAGQRLKVRFQKVEFTATSSRRQNIRLLTQAYFNILQADISRYPEQYFWMHRRWKNREDVHYDEKETFF